MDLMNRGFRPNQQANEEGVSAHTAEKPKSKLHKIKSGNFLNVSYVALLFSVTVVLVGLILSLVLFSDKSREEKFVENGKFQAVFLNNGQVYFGNINELNKDFLRISNIYYLRVNQQVQPGQQAAQNDVSLVKLGCELHGPQDSMVVNRDQITFWENLKDDGQVAKAVAEYVKANPNGQDCSQQQNNAPASAPATNNTNTDPNNDSAPSNTTNNSSTNNSSNNTTNNNDR